MKTFLPFLIASLAALLIGCGNDPNQTYYYSDGTVISDTMQLQVLKRETVKLIGESDEDLKVYTSLKSGVNATLRNRLPVLVEELYKNINWGKSHDPEFKKTVDDFKKQGKFFDANVVAIDNKTGQIAAYFSTTGDADWDGVSKKENIGSIHQTLSFAQGLEREFKPDDLYPRVDRTTNMIDPNFRKPFFEAIEHGSPTYANGLDGRYSTQQSEDFLQKLGVDHGKLSDGVFRFKTIISLLDVTKAYSSFYNKGVVNSPTLIDRIVDGNKKELFKRKSKSKRGLKAETAEEIMQIFAYQYLHEDGESFDRERNVPEFISQFKSLEANFSGSGWLMAITDDYTIGVRTFACHPDVSFPKRARSMQLRDRTFPLWLATIKLLRGGKKVGPIRSFDVVWRIED